MKPTEPRRSSIPDIPGIAGLYNDTRLAPLWMIVRVYLGYLWLNSGLGKVTNPAWMETGAAIRGYWTRAVAIPEQGNPPITYGWYRTFLQALIDGEHHVWFARLIVIGEILVGVGLIVGAIVGLTALFGALMNLNFMLAGTTSTNPVMFALAILLMLAWKTAGYWGIDRFVLPVVSNIWARPDPDRLQFR